MHYKTYCMLYISHIHICFTNAFTYASYDQFYRLTLDTVRYYRCCKACYKCFLYCFINSVFTMHYKNISEMLYISGIDMIDKWSRMHVYSYNRCYKAW